MENEKDQVAIRSCDKRVRMCCVSKNEKVDRISWLPEPIIHAILDCLPSNDAARTCILSKTWKSFTSSYPILHLDHNLFGLKCLLAAGNSTHEPDIYEIREEFISFVNHHLSKVKHQNLALRKLSLNVAIQGSECFPSVDHLMHSVRKLYKVEELCLCVQTCDSLWKHENEIDEDDVCYQIPFSVLATKGLRSLYVRGCQFGSLVGNHFSSNFSSLQRLCLFHAALDEETISNLTRYCPGIEILEFDQCTFWIEYLQLSMFPRLKKASFIKSLHGWLSMISIDNPGLESFKGELYARWEFTAGACHNIRELTLSRGKVYPPNPFVDFTSTFPLIEEANISTGLRCMEKFKAANLYLRKLSLSEVRVNKIYIDCPNLKWFKFDGNGLEEVYLNCPNLSEFLLIQSVGGTVPELPLFNLSAALKKIYFNLGLNYRFDVSWFMRIRRLIEQMAEHGHAIHLRLGCILKMVEVVPLGFKAFQASLPNNIHLTMVCRFGFENRKNRLAIVDGLIWSTRPTTLTIIACSGIEVDYFLKDMCEKLADKFLYGTCEKFCNKCWWHYLKDFEVSSLPTEDIKGNVPAFVKLNQNTPKCHFKFYWRSNEGCQDNLPDMQQTCISKGHARDFGENKGILSGLLEKIEGFFSYNQ